jgi:hypothetical protein
MQLEICNKEFSSSDIFRKFLVQSVSWLVAAGDQGNANVEQMWLLMSGLEPRQGKGEGVAGGDQVRVSL